MRRGVAALGLAVVGLVAGGCDEEVEPSGPRGGWPLGAAGMACQLLDYAVVEQALGTAFDTAGGATVESTYSCVLTQGEREYPDLTLAVTPTSANEVIFMATLVPSGASDVEDLGRSAYLMHRPAGDGHGPAVEVGWLSASGRLVVLRYTFAEGADAEAVAEMGTRIADYAQQLEQSLPVAATSEGTAS